MSRCRPRVVLLPPTIAALAVLLLVACAFPALPAEPGPWPAPVERRDVDLGAVTLHVAISGPAGAPPVVLLHGFPETGDAWREVAADLAADHRVVVPDLRGAGRSSFAPPGTDAYTKRALAADLAALATRLGLPPATVVGHDMGAMTALAWARERPDQVRRLVLAGGGVPGFGLLEQGPPHLVSFAAAPPGVLERALAGRVPDFLARFVQTGAQDQRGERADRGPPALDRLIDEAIAAYSPLGRLDAAFGQYRALEQDAADNLGDPRPLSMPVLVLTGARPDLTATTVAALAPARRVVVIPGAGHYLPTERPAEAAAAIRDHTR